MPTILPVKGIHPILGDNCYIAPNATIVGDVVMGNECSIWFNDMDVEAGQTARAGFELRAVAIPIDVKRSYQRRQQRQDDCNRKTEQRRLHAVTTAGRSLNPHTGQKVCAA